MGVNLFAKKSPGERIHPQLPTIAVEPTVGGLWIDCLVPVKSVLSSLCSYFDQCHPFTVETVPTGRRAPVGANSLAKKSPGELVHPQLLTITVEPTVSGLWIYFCMPATALLSSLCSDIEQCHLFAVETAPTGRRAPVGVNLFAKKSPGERIHPQLPTIAVEPTVGCLWINRLAPVTAVLSGLCSDFDQCRLFAVETAPTGRRAPVGANSFVKKSPGERIHPQLPTIAVEPTVGGLWIDCLVPVKSVLSSLCSYFDQYRPFTVETVPTGRRAPVGANSFAKKSPGERIHSQLPTMSVEPTVSGLWIDCCAPVATVLSRLCSAFDRFQSSSPGRNSPRARPWRCIFSLRVRRGSCSSSITALMSPLLRARAWRRHWAS